MCSSDLDVSLQPRKVTEENQIEDLNLGTEAEPKIAKFSKKIPEEYKEKYLKLFQSYKDVFAWSYQDLKTFDISIMQHKIPPREDAKPYKQKLRQINPLLLPSIEKEIKKLLKAKIIVPLRYSEWVANLVPVRKKNGEIRLCVDFRNLNGASLKDNYPLPKMDHILQKVVGASRMSMMDGFYGYNQVAVHLVS